MAEMAYACPLCATQAAQNLSEVAETTPAARDVAHGLSGRQGGGGSGKPGSRLPLDLGATARLDAVANSLGGWARVVAEERGVYPDPLPPGFDTIPHAARFLAEHLEWFRHREFAGEFLTDVDACLRAVRGIARGPSEQKYLGPCGVPVSEIDELVDAYGDDPSVGLVVNRCDGDVYGRAGAEKGTCRTCGAQVDQSERRAWLDDEVRRHAFRASEIAGAYGINVNTIRSWAARGLLLEHGRDRDDRPLYGVGDVLDLAAAAAARREENRARRARRKESEEVA
jgi:DNA-binding transcriptional MerR regulator